MRTITPFKQLVTSEIERLRTIASAPHISAHTVLAGFPTLSNSYTMKHIAMKARARKGLLARVFGN
ncbi:MAG: hypothetical protein ACOYMZ_01895 [Minisyncoccia bacterium]